MWEVIKSSVRGCLMNSADLQRDVRRKRHFLHRPSFLSRPGVGLDGLHVGLHGDCANVRPPAEHT
jgi:hypothetical protein